MEQSPKQAMLNCAELPAQFQQLGEALVCLAKRISETKAFINTLAEERNAELSRIRELFLVLMKIVPECIVLLDVENSYEYVLSHVAERMKENRPTVVGLLREKLWQHAKTYNEGSSQWNLSFPDPDQETMHTDAQLYYRVKSYPMHWMGRKAMLHILQDCTDEKEKEQRLLRDARTDPLTGLHNRRYAMELLHSWHDEKQSFCISMIDVDYLKFCNDLFGHEMGDTYLLNVCECLNLLPYDKTICRIGGDEFLIIALNRSQEQQDAELERIRRKFRDNQSFDDLPFSPSFSFGTVVNVPDGGQTLGEILKEADIRMYRYKLANKQTINNLEGFEDRRLQ